MGCVVGCELRGEGGGGGEPLEGDLPFIFQLFLCVFLYKII